MVVYLAIKNKNNVKFLIATFFYQDSLTGVFPTPTLSTTHILIYLLNFSHVASLRYACADTSSEFSIALISVEYTNWY